jgi:hypothetical protein
MALEHRPEEVRMQAPPRITVEVPVVAVGSGPADYESLGNFVEALRRPQGLHLTLLHVGILDDFARDVEDWTKGITAAGDTIRLEVRVPQHVHDYQVSLVEGLRTLLDGLLVDNVDDFILGSPALGFRYPHWVPHVAVGRPPLRKRGPWNIPPVTVACGPSRIRNGQFLPAADEHTAN